jgi:hypothetical protein
VFEVQQQQQQQREKEIEWIKKAPCKKSDGSSKVDHIWVQ